MAEFHCTESYIKKKKKRRKKKHTQRKTKITLDYTGFAGHWAVSLSI